jgi:sodium/pantothenate symporter
MHAGAPLAWTLFALYLAGTFWLAWLGHKKTKNFSDFAVGGRSMGPVMAGLTLGACLASTVTFVLNPGFVYAYGLPALFALTIPLFLGVFAGLAVLGPGFRKHGATATTLPVWLGERYGSQGLRAWFAALTLFHVFYVVAIVVGAAVVMEATMGVSYPVAVGIVVAVVFSYTFLGGTYAHAYTNTAQGIVMLFTAVVIFAFAARSIGNPLDALATLQAEDANMVGLLHPESPFYRHWFEVLVCPFVIGFALVAQPHLLVKTLYLKRARDMATFGATGLACFVIFSLVLFAGLAARLDLGAGIPQNAASSIWIAETFPPALGAVVSVAILAAAMSTLDGLLVAVSAIVGSDLAGHPDLLRKLGKDGSPEARGKIALQGGRAAVVGIGLVAFVVALQRPAVVAIFGSVGAYALLCASLPAVLYGVLAKRPPSAKSVFVASIIGMSVHLALYLGVTVNTGLTATVGLLVALPIPALFNLGRAPQAEFDLAAVGVAPELLDVSELEPAMQPLTSASGRLLPPALE